MGDKQLIMVCKVNAAAATELHQLSDCTAAAVKIAAIHPEAPPPTIHRFLVIHPRLLPLIQAGQH
ncbi:hypothetical protein [Gilvimarinus xylanilyticus]|uniref:Uncharacterized protein n=1 Tax=Gilvimarinus xylanilyticus TaxID=2944139 RepID=A0A9X2I071_9GAMM|nr:hypothetical protein [Gilvimarinus xylanilyticus]MCP8897801.1 hypothetical protein [Gilvimarinus xylanilyticus]